MKKLYNTFLFLLLPVVLMASNFETGKFTKQKSIKKAYIVNPDAGIAIKNSYGNVTVNTWNEDKVELDILIKVSGDNESWVDKRLNDINVDIEALKHLVSAETKISKSRGGGKNNSIEISYNIKIPKNGGVKVDNSYGSIITGDLFANTNLSCDYGKIALAKLNGSTNIINIDYCSKSSIESVKTATIKADYSGLTITEFGKINLSADYTDVNFGNGNDVKYNCNYGKLILGKLDNLEGNGDYVSINAGTISNSLKIDTDYSKITIGEFGSKFSSATINSGYTAVDLNYDPSAAFDIDVNIKYANFNYPKELEMTSKRENGSSKSYQGYYRKSGENKITVRSEYGNVNLSRK